MKRRAFLPTVLLSCAATLAQPAPTVTPSPPQTAETPDAQRTFEQRTFEQGVTFLKTFYYGFSKVDLDTQIERYRAQLNDACASAFTACPVDTGVSTLKALYRSLNDRHLYALNAQEAATKLLNFDAQPPRVSTFGLTLGAAGERGTVVLDVLPDGPAARAGIVPGDLLRGNGGTLPFVPDREPQLTVRVRHGDEQRMVTLTRADTDPAALPVLYAPADAPAGVLVLRIPSFSFTERVGPKVHELVHEAQARGVTGLVVDVRRGPGGSNYECEMAAAAFIGPFHYLNVTGRGDYPGGWLGDISDDTAERAFFDVTLPVTQQHLAYPLPNPARWTGKTVVLVDSRSASCHEYMAYFMQQKGIPVIGEPTFGLLNTASLLLPLPGGGLVAMPAVRSAHDDGTIYPDHLPPNEQVTSDPNAPARGEKDPVMERAFQMLRN